MKKQLKASALKQDLRVAQAKALLLEAVNAHSKEIKSHTVPMTELVSSYEEMIKEMSNARGAPLFYPYLGSGIGNSSLVELADGSIKYDMISGIGVHFFGHSHPLIVEAQFNAALEDILMQGNLQQNTHSLSLSKLLVQESGLDHCFFTTSGVMANENAVKLAFQKNFPATRILAFNRCFAGRSLTFSQVTDKPSFREGLPINIDVDYIPFFDPHRPEESIEHAVHELKKAIKRYPKQHAIMFFELVQGEGGFYPGSKEFFEPLMQICKQNHIAVFSDEIQTFGRTHSLFTFKHFGLESYVDIVAIGKLTQVCATLFTKDYLYKPGLLAQTFTGSTASILACESILRHLLDNHYYGTNGRMSQIFEQFRQHFERIEKAHPNVVSGPYGLGAMVAFTPLDGSVETTTHFAKELFKAGVIGFIAGADPTRIRFLPPAATITDHEIAEVMKIVEETLVNLSKKQKEKHK